MVHPAPGLVEKKLTDSLWNWVGKIFHTNQDLKKQIEDLKAENLELRSGKQEFEKLKSTLECRPDDDGMYYKIGMEKGGPCCPLCLDADHKLIQLIHGDQEGTYRCALHKQVFQTKERREKDRRQMDEQYRSTLENWRQWS